MNAFTKGNVADRMASMQEEEVKFIAQQMVAAEREEELWKIAKRTSVMAAIPIVEVLSDSEWRPAKERERPIFKKMTSEAQTLQNFDPSLVRLVKHKTPLTLAADEEMLLGPNGKRIVILNRGEKKGESGLRVVRASDKKMIHRVADLSEDPPRNTEETAIERVENKNMAHFISPCGSFLLSAIPVPRRNLDQLRLRRLSDGKVVGKTRTPGQGCCSFYIRKYYPIYSTREYIGTKPEDDSHSFCPHSRSFNDTRLELYPDHRNPETSCYQFSRDGKRLYCAGPESLQVLAVPSLAVVDEFEIKGNPLRFSAFQESGFILNQTERCIETRELPGGKLIAEIQHSLEWKQGRVPGDLSYVEAKASYDGNFLVLPAEDFMDLSFHALPSFETVAGLDTESNHTTESKGDWFAKYFSPDGNHFAALSEEPADQPAKQSTINLTSYNLCRNEFVWEKEISEPKYYPSSKSNNGNYFRWGDPPLAFGHHGRLIMLWYKKGYKHVDLAYYNDNVKRYTPQKRVKEWKRGFLFCHIADREVQDVTGTTQELIMTGERDEKQRVETAISPSDDAVDFWLAEFSRNGILASIPKGASRSYRIKKRAYRRQGLLSGVRSEAIMVLLWSILPLHLSRLPVSKLTMGDLSLIDDFAEHHPDCELKSEEKILFSMITSKIMKHRQFDVEVEGSDDLSTSDHDIHVESVPFA